MVELKEYQAAAVESLLDAVSTAWSSEKTNAPVLLKAPTGSGKTVIMANLLAAVDSAPTLPTKKAFIWMTFSEQLTEQSRQKFISHFGPSSASRFLTYSSIENSKLQAGDVLFLNWEKVISRSAANRKLRRPEDPTERKESGNYFEDLLDEARAEGLELVMFIDEAHRNVSTDLARKIMSLVSSRVVVHVSATPPAEVIANAAQLGTFVNVDRQKVIDSGLIKEKIVTQTSEDLSRITGRDFDHALLELGLEKRKHLAKKYKEIGKDINPLLLVQLPNDDSKLADTESLSKEQIVMDFLRSKGFDESRVARWFDNHPKPEGLEANNDSHDVLLFKLAASTGWDCPRAQVLVMYRDVKAEQRYIQTVGRILRMPEPEKTLDYRDYPELRCAYLFTNYDKQEIIGNWNNEAFQPPLTTRVERRIEDPKIALSSESLARTDYGDLSSSHKFQKFFLNFFDEHFGLSDIAFAKDRQEKLSEVGFELHPFIREEIVVDAEFTDYDTFGDDFGKSGQVVNVEISSNDLEKKFSLSCWNLLKEQEDEEARVGNVSRSWSAVKSAFRMWFRTSLSFDTASGYKFALYDLLQGSNSKLRPAFTACIKSYLATQQESSSPRRQVTTKFILQPAYDYPPEVELHRFNKYALTHMPTRNENYPGKKNELEFANFLDSNELVQWWFKQETGIDFFGVVYSSSPQANPSVFYPDWLVMLESGTLLVLDTKAGFTAEKAGAKADALVKKLKSFEGDYRGGIAVKRNGVWLVNGAQPYSYNDGELGPDWQPFNEFGS